MNESTPVEKLDQEMVIAKTKTTITFSSKRKEVDVGGGGRKRRGRDFPDFHFQGKLTFALLLCVREQKDERSKSFHLE